MGLQDRDHSFLPLPAVGGCNSAGDDDDVAAVEAAQAFPEADRDPGLGQAGRDEQGSPCPPRLSPTPAIR